MQEQLPERLFHGSVFQFEAFESDRSNGFSVPRKGVYLTDDLVTCREFGHLIYEVRCDAAKLLDARDPRHPAVWEAIFNAMENAGPKARRIWDAAYGNPVGFVAQGGLQLPEMVEAFSAAGYEGLMFADSFGNRGFTSLVVFDPARVAIMACRDLSDVDEREIHDYDWDEPEASPHP